MPPNSGRKPSLKGAVPPPSNDRLSVSTEQAARNAAGAISASDDGSMGNTNSGSGTPMNNHGLDKAHQGSASSLAMDNICSARSASPAAGANANAAAGPQRAMLDRRIELGAVAAVNVLTNAAFPSNYVSTTKYELWNVVPKNLWEQFHRVANIWFLIVSIFQMLPLELSPTNKYATFFPLCCVLFLTFCKDAYEDYSRRREDRQVNNQMCMVVDTSDREGRVRPEKWKDVAVGSFLRINRDEPVPADMVLLTCSNEDGVAYVDTVQLDGESSLKPKFALEETMRITETKELLMLHGHLDTEPPNQLVQSFSGTLYLQGFPRGVPIDAKGFLLRGSTIRNTSWVYGLVVFTGVDTKIVQNWRKTPSKRSRIEVTANTLLLIVFGFLLFAAAVSALARGLFLVDGSKGAAQILWAWPEPDRLRDNNFLAFITFMIAYNNLIPISLYVTTDLARTFQGLRMEMDSSMYHAETDSFCRCKNSGLNEDLGQIEFVLTDKTGTLTENKMEFKACSIAGKTYGRWDDEEGPVDYVAAVPPEHICRPLSARALLGHKWSDTMLNPQDQLSGGPTASPPAPTPKACVYGKWDEEQGLAKDGGDPSEQTEGGSIGGSSAQAAAIAAAAAAGTPGNLANSRTPSRKQTSGGSSASPRDNSKELMVDQFFMCLATCHTAIVEQIPCTRTEAKSSRATSTPSVATPTSMTASAAAVTQAGSQTGISSEAALAASEAARSANTKPSAPTPDASSSRGSKVTFSIGGDSVPVPEREITVGNEDKQEVEELMQEAARVAFRSSSPDEEALVAAARDYGYFFRRKVASRLTVNVRGKDQYYQVLIVNEFSSERKRMSVLVQRVEAPTAFDNKDETPRPDPRVGMMERNETPSATFNPVTCGQLPDMQYSSEDSDDFSKSSYPAVLYAKGADNVMLERLSPSTVGVKVAKRHMKNFASQGLRTLILAKRELTPNEVDNFVRKMNEAKGAFMNRDLMMEAVATEMERDMHLLGVTAVEDRIQEGVPQTVNMLLRAGVKVWMLTGDNMETAINIGLACKLVEPSMRLYKLDASSGDATPEMILRLLDEYYTEISQQLSAERKQGDFKYCLVLHGKVLYTIMEEEQARLRQLFLAIACSSCSVVACRLAPAQKAALVKLVRSHVVGNPTTLAIGDGGNDASMIQEAHVGVGILGVEGRQAANAADFTIGQFRFLQNLLFVHGRWNLRRVSIIIGYSFYKNFLLVLPLAFYSYFNGFSGTPLYESYLLATFNLAFTSLPILIVGAFDVDVSAKMALLVPSLYQLGISKRYFNSWTLIGWISRGVLHSILLFLSMYTVTLGWPGGPNFPDQLVMGSWAYGACVCIANVILLLHTKAWMDWHVLVVLLSIALFLPVMSLYSDGAFFLASMFEPQMVGVATVLFGHPRSWLALFLVTSACGLSDLAASFCQKLYYPDAADLLQEVQLGHLSGLDKLQGEAWSQLEPGAKAEDILKMLPSPPPRVHQVKPEGRVGLKPLRVVRRSGGIFSRGGGEFKVDSVVPVPTRPEGGRPHDDLINSNSIITYPESWSERFRFWCIDMAKSLWKRQWCEMTVTELAGGLGYDRIEVSKHFKSAIRSSMSEGRRQSMLEDSMGLGGVGRRAGPLDKRCGPLAVEGEPGEAAADPQDSSAADGNEVVQDLMYSIVTLRFLSPAQESAFKTFLSKQAAQLFRMCLASFVFATFMWFVYELLITYNASSAELLVAISCLPGSAMIAWFLRTAAFENRAEWIIVTAVMLGIACKHCYDIFEEHTGLLFNAYFPIFIIAGLRVRFTFISLVLLYHMVSLLLRYWLLTDAFPSSRSEQELLTGGGELPAAYFVLMLGITSLSSHYAYMLEKIMRKDFFVLDSIWRSKNQAVEILNGMFPKEVVDHVLMKVRKWEGMPGMRKLQEDRGMVTILFCDIFDFDGITQKLKPMELVQLLDLVWMLFDRLCERHGTVKIETVGKTYMAAAMPPDGTNATGEQHSADAAAAVLTAIGMLGLVSKRFTGIGAITHVDVRIGIHTGRALSGVVGSTKPQFALFGDTVNTASRMQSTGKKGCLHVSSATYDLLKDDSRFEWRAKKTEVKGKGSMDTYFLTKYNSEIQESTSRSAKSKGLKLPASTHADSASNLSDAPMPSTFYHAAMTMDVMSDTVKDDDAVAASSTGIAAGAAEAMAADRAHTAATLMPVAMQQQDPQESQSADAAPSASLPALPAAPSTTTDCLPDRSPSPARSGESRIRTPQPGDEISPSIVSSPDGAGEPSDWGEAERDLTWINENMRLRGMMVTLFAQPQAGENAGNGRRRKNAKLSIVTETAVTTANWLCPSWLRRVCPCWGSGDSGATMRMRGSPLFSQWVSYVAFWVCYSAESLCVAFTNVADQMDRTVAIAIRMGYIFSGLAVSIAMYMFGKKNRWGVRMSSFASSVFANCIAIAVFTGFSCAFVSNIYWPGLGHSRNRTFWMVFEGFFFVMGLMHLCRLNPQGLIPVCLCLVTVCCILVYVGVVEQQFFGNELLLECMGSALFLFLMHIIAIIFDPRRASADHKAICEEHERVSELLDSMLPKEVLAEMKSGHLSLAYSYEDMTLLFADIVGFTKYCATHSAEQAVHLVTRLFAEFDREAVRLGIYKVCTIGDAYVVVNEPRTQLLDKYSDCESVFSMGKYMLHTIARIRVEVSHEGLDMRIGLHVGRFVGGVIGTKRLRFDVWGEDVLIGNNVESHGIAGQICVSQSAREVLQEKVRELEFTFNQDISLKTGRIVRTYKCTPAGCSAFNDSSFLM